MYETTGCRADIEFAHHGVLFTRAFAAACPVPFDQLGAILDFGVGVGRLARMFKGFRGRYVGVDIDPRNIEWVSAHLDHVTPVLTEPRTPLPFPDNCFDAVFSISVFTHMNEADCLFYLHELARVTKPTGALVLSTQGNVALQRALTEPPVAMLLAMTPAELKTCQDALNGPRRFYFHEQYTHLTQANYDYGMTFIEHSFMEASAPAKFPLVESIPGALGDFQDLVVLRAAPPAARPKMRPAPPAPAFKDDRGVLVGPLATSLRQSYCVDTAIHPRDYLMSALLWAVKDIETAFRQYVNDGRYNAADLYALIQRHHAGYQPGGAPFRLLDFASGYGRIGRHVANIMIEARYTAMDIHAEAVAFLRHRLGLDALLSDFDPARLPGKGTFDVVFASSFFSHLRKEAIEPWLAGLRDLVVVGGTLIITTHGARSHETVMRECRVAEDGYGMLETSEQRDISTAHYVHAITLEPFMRARIAAVPGLELITFEAGAWLKHQDIYVLRRGPILDVSPPPKLQSDGLISRFLRHLTAGKR
jgi:SAM-dependent methyltransferase